MRDGKFDKAPEGTEGRIRAVVLQDDARRHAETEALYRRIVELEEKLDGADAKKSLSSLTKSEKSILGLFEVERNDGKLALKRGGKPYPRGITPAGGSCCSQPPARAGRTCSWASRGSRTSCPPKAACW